ncbi:MAG: isochorismatase family cysteine hydrolase [Byssovorax sp.]
MSDRLGPDVIFTALLARAPSRTVDALAALNPDDAADLVECRELLVELALTAPVVAPSSTLRERLLAAHPSPQRPKRPVLIVLDMIQDHLTAGSPVEVPRALGIVPALKIRIAAERARRTPIIFVCDTHEPDDTDFNDWPVHALAGTPGADVWPDLGPEPGDHIVRKPTYSAFTRSTLAPLLDELGADEIILTGCATELGLSVTATDALQRGFVVTIPPECQAGVSPMAEGLAMLTLSTMPPYDPRYLQKRR